MAEQFLLLYAHPTFEGIMSSFIPHYDDGQGSPSDNMVPILLKRKGKTNAGIGKKLISNMKNPKVGRMGEGADERKKKSDLLPRDLTLLPFVGRYRINFTSSRQVKEVPYAKIS